jgi:hypothetical protein
MRKTADLEGLSGAGVSPKRIGQLDTAIDDWRKLVTKRMALGEQEAEAKTKVNALMHEHGIETYLYTDDGDVEKECVLVESVKLRKRSKDDDNED